MLPRYSCRSTISSKKLIYNRNHLLTSGALSWQIQPLNPPHLPPFPQHREHQVVDLRLPPDRYRIWMTMTMIKVVAVALVVLAAPARVAPEVVAVVAMAPAVVARAVAEDSTGFGPVLAGPCC